MSRGKGWFNGLRYPYVGRHHHHRYEPLYDEHSDYNTNAKSYYDYLARFNKYLKVITDFINRLMNRNIEFKNTNSVNFTKEGDWVDNGECEPLNYDDVIKVSAIVKISQLTEERKLLNTIKKTFIVPNGTMVKSDGVWSPDYEELLNEIDKMLGLINNRLDNIDQQISNLQNQINELDQRITNNENSINEIDQRVTNNTNKIDNLELALKKIVNNLYNSGAITSNNINNFTFKTGRNIATGNINLFGGTSDGNSFIKTSDDKTNNDITAGY